MTALTAPVFQKLPLGDSGFPTLQRVFAVIDSFHHVDSAIDLDTRLAENHTDVLRVERVGLVVVILQVP